MQDEQQPGLVGLSAEIVSAYVAKNHIQTSEIPQLIASVHDALRNVAKPRERCPSIRRFDPTTSSALRTVGSTNH
jgi:predicted transcriptional regulator